MSAGEDKAYLRFTRQKQQKQNASHRIAITVQQLLIRLTDESQKMVLTSAGDLVYTIARFVTHSSERSAVW